MMFLPNILWPDAAPHETRHSQDHNAIHFLFLAKQIRKAYLKWLRFALDGLNPLKKAL